MIKDFLEGLVIGLEVIGNVTLFNILMLEFNIIIAFLSLAMCTIGIMLHYLDT